ncbi:hypothetical protein AVEN_91000-1 [Araneus ventricosus]|uniref:Uncharacterized protein n=1 Tax=Araneus ventricosus TaxID=182803 RepID=A0A4Y2MPK2_ARAVE|nr:hypothetical protein AVEN_91000-1 [Araneus ventricosus]
MSCSNVFSITVKISKVMTFKSLTNVKTSKTCVIREFSEEFSISEGSFQPILTEDLGLRPVFAKFVAKPLSADQEEERLSAAFDVPE